jgi:hypothetical protein
VTGVSSTGEALLRTCTKERFPAERYALLKRAARHQARETVRRRVTRWGQEDAAALVAHDPLTEDAAG